MGQRLLQLKELERKIGLKTTSIYSLMDKGLFPRPREIRGTVRVGWHEADVDKWMNALPVQDKSANE